MKKEIKFPLVYCPFCKEDMLVNINTMIKNKVKGHIAWCPQCENVLNFESDIKINWIIEKEANKLGWKRMKKQPKKVDN